jgi:replicative DNA helicase
MSDLILPPFAIEAEQSVLGALLLDNDAIDRIGDLLVEHFYRQDHRLIFAEIVKQITAGKTCDVITIFEGLAGNAEGIGGLSYLNAIAQSTPSSANIRRYADTVVDRAIKRQLMTIGGEAQDAAISAPLEALTLVDQFAAKLEALAQRKTRKEPRRFSDMLDGYVSTIEARIAGTIKPIATGFSDLDNRLDGGLERGTLTVIAARPGMGKTAMGLALSRNVAESGSSLFLSMEMSADQIIDRNIAAIGKLPVKWLRKPEDETPQGKLCWANMSHAFGVAESLNMHIDDETALNMLAIRAKTRATKRKHGLDLLVVDQLSFITGSKCEKSYEAVGEYTRGLISLGKELNLAVVLLCQLSRECEKRNDKRPILSDLAMSGSIEQDASNVIFLYRDEIYVPDSNQKGICEVIVGKQRQGEPGRVGLAYIGEQTRFESLKHAWHPAPPKTAPTRSRGFRDNDD